MNIFSRKKNESSVQVLINTLRANMSRIKQLDDAGKEKFAEQVRKLWLINDNLACHISKTDPKKGKKLKQQSDKDEVEVKRFLSEMGVGRYSPENQQKMDDIDKALEVLLEETKHILDRHDD